jgi:hypothetical protein
LTRGSEPLPCSYAHPSHARTPSLSLSPSITHLVAVLDDGDEAALDLLLVWGDRAGGLEFRTFGGWRARAASLLHGRASTHKLHARSCRPSHPGGHLRVTTLDGREERAGMSEGAEHAQACCFHAYDTCLPLFSPFSRLFLLPPLTRCTRRPPSSSPMWSPRACIGGRPCGVCCACE